MTWISAIKLLPEALREAMDGLLIIYDDLGRVIKLGWIKEAANEEGRAKLKLGPTMKLEEEEYSPLESDVFKVTTKGFIAVKNSGAYIFRDPGLIQPTFSVIPYDALDDQPRNHETLRAYVEIITS